MYVHFTFNEGNPYITTTDEALFNMVCKYDLQQTGTQAFHCNESPFCHYPKAYRDKQATLRNFAIDWQSNFGEYNYSWSELANWQSFFEEYGRKYGLLREFRENAIV
jgi:hypothetical protein